MLEGDRTLIARQPASQRAFYRVLAGASDGAVLLDLPGGVQATAAPLRPWFSIFNSVVYEDAEAWLHQLVFLVRSDGARSSRSGVGDRIAAPRAP